MKRLGLWLLFLGTTALASVYTGGGGGAGGGISSINADSTAAQVIAVDTAGNDVAVATSSGTTTLSVPNASATARGVVSTGAQTFAGAKTLSGTTLNGTTTFPSSVTIASGQINIPTYNGVAAGLLNIGSVPIGTDNGQASRLQIYVPNGGRFTITENNGQVVTMLDNSAAWGSLNTTLDWEMKWGMGKSDNYGWGLVRGYGDWTAASSSTTEADLLSETVRANVLQANGESLTVTAWGTTGANGNAKVIRLYVGGTAIGTINTSANAKVWKFWAEVTRSTGASAEKYVVEMNIDGTVTIVSGTLALNTANTIVVKTTGEEVVTGESLKIDYGRAGNTGT